MNTCEMFVCVCVQGFFWPLLTQRSLCDVHFKGTLMPNPDKRTSRQTFCIYSPAWIWVTMARHEYQCQACQTKQRRAGGMMADATRCQYNSPSNWYGGFCSNRREPPGNVRINFPAQHGNTLSEGGPEKPYVTVILTWLRGVMCQVENSKPTSRGLLLLWNDNSSNMTKYADVECSQ